MIHKIIKINFFRIVLTSIILFSPLNNLNNLLAQAEIEVPEKIEGEAGDFIPVVVKTKGTQVRWLCCDPKLKIFPDILIRDPLTTVVTSKYNGKYTLYCWTAIDNIPSRAYPIEIVIGSSPDPDPPTPNPTPNEFQKLYDTDSTPDKANYLISLIKVYDSVLNKSFPNWGAAHLEIEKNLADNGVKDKIPNIRNGISVITRAKFPTKASTPFDPQLFQSVIGDILKQLKAIKG